MFHGGKHSRQGTAPIIHPGGGGACAIKKAVNNIGLINIHKLNNQFTLNFLASRCDVTTECQPAL